MDKASLDPHVELRFSCSAFEKNFYIEHPDVTKRPQEEADAWRASKGIVVRGDGVPKPVMTFDEASMPEYVLSEVLKCGFDKPTPIQSQGWPMALLGRDMVGVSATGSGKTLAFLLPAMIHINAQVSVPKESLGAVSPFCRSLALCRCECDCTERRSQALNAVSCLN